MDFRPVRAVAVTLVALCLLSLSASYVTSGAAGVTSASGGANVEPAIDAGAVDAVDEFPAPGRVTAVTTQDVGYVGEPAEIVAFDDEGRLLYHNDTYGTYFDVDPVPGTRYTVEYVAAYRGSSPACSADTCTWNVVERVNLSTDETRRIHLERVSNIGSSRWHDVDRVNDTHLAVADVRHDRVFTLDVRSDTISWQWNASEHYPPDSGGSEGDFTHLNDVEVLDDGRFMASPRNMDEVIFLRPGEGVQKDWTLGEEGDYDVLKEQHNPDYIPAERGGPAVLVADSENNRVVEYTRDGGAWERTWVWRDARLQWPRDADRLPSGGTLVVDSNGNRILEIAPDGSVTGATFVVRAYDAELLATGDESAGGPARTTPTRQVRSGPVGDAVILLKDVLPTRVVNGLVFVSPAWVGMTELLVVGLLLATLLGWGVAELYRSSLTVGGVRKKPWS